MPAPQSLHPAQRIALVLLLVLVLIGLSVVVHACWSHMDSPPPTALTTETGGATPEQSGLSSSPDVGHPLRLPVKADPQRLNAPYLNIPAVVSRPNGLKLRPYFALRKGLTVRYLGPIFSNNATELIWVPAQENGSERLIWQTYEDGKGGIVGLFPGNTVTLLDDLLYDLDVGTLFVKVAKEGFPPGYMLLETLLGETEPVDDSLIVAKQPEQFRARSSVDFQGVRLYEQTVNLDVGQLRKDIGLLLNDADYATTLSGGVAGGVHPLYATSMARSVLFTAMTPAVPEDLRKEAVAAVEHFYEKYVEAAKVEVAPGLISWPYKFEWVMNWGVKLSPPWYSPFANSQVVSVAALLYRATGKESYRKMADDASRFITKRMSEGGSEYAIDGFRLPAEYVYQTPPLPNVRVLDGELGVAIALYNSARLLGDSEMLRQSGAYFASIAMNLEGYLKADGGLWFSKYIENMPEGYGWPMWALLQNAAIITKDRRFTEYARRVTPAIAKHWCDQYGC